MAMAGGISEHMLTSWSSYICLLGDTLIQLHCRYLTSLYLFAWSIYMLFFITVLLIIYMSLWCFTDEVKDPYAYQTCIYSLELHQNQGWGFLRVIQVKPAFTTSNPPQYFFYGPFQGGFSVAVTLCSCVGGFIRGICFSYLFWKVVLRDSGISREASFIFFIYICTVRMCLNISVCMVQILYNFTVHRCFIDICLHGASHI